MTEATPEGTKVPVTRWARLGPFLPTSPPQVLAYLRHRGYPLVKDRKTKKPTSSEEALLEIQRKLEPKDPILTQIIEIKHLTKAIGYLDDAMLGRDGKLHPLYSFIPKTGRLSSKNPNLMNLPQGRRGAVTQRAAAAIRSAIIPSRPGWVLAEFDWVGIEAMLVGYFAQDPDYMRICKLDIHSYITSFGVGEPADPAWDDTKLGAHLAYIKKKYEGERASFKKAGHANNYGQGIFNMARDLGCTLEKARWYKEIMAKAAPKVSKWREDTILRAHSEGQLVNPFGHVMAFFEALKVDADGKAVYGKEANEALAFPAQSTGAAMLREVLVTLGNHAWEGERFALLIPTHDSILIEVDPVYLREVILMIKAEMERPWAELGGLVIEAEVKVGATLGEMKGFRAQAS